MEIGGSEQQQQPEEEPLVLSVVPDVEENGTPPQPRNHTRDVHILSIAFLFVFSAYGASQNLESTVNTEEDLGTTSLGIVYVSFTLFSLFGSPMVRVLGSKKSLVLGTTGYWLFIASNLKPSWFAQFFAFCICSCSIGMLIDNCVLQLPCYGYCSCRMHLPRTGLNTAALITRSS